MSDVTKFTCTGCKLSTWSMFDLSGKPHLECPQGSGHWVKVGKNKYPKKKTSALTVTAHISPDCPPETLQALSEMIQRAIIWIDRK